MIGEAFLSLERRVGQNGQDQLFWRRLTGLNALIPFIEC
jgi:hypothetical protein